MTTTKSPTLLLKTTEKFRRDHPVEIEPGQACHISDLVAEAVEPTDLIAPSYAICRMVRQPDGDYRPVPCDWSEYVSASPEALRRIGLTMARKTLLRLWANNYIEMRRPTPQTLEVNLESLVRHFREVTADPNFWKQSAGDGTRRTRAEAYDAKQTWV